LIAYLQASKLRQTKPQVNFKLNKVHFQHRYHCPNCSLFDPPSAFMLMYHRKLFKKKKKREM